MLEGDWFRLLAIICGLVGAMLGAFSKFKWGFFRKLSEEELERVQKMCGLVGAILLFSSPIIYNYGYNIRKEEIETMKGVLKPPPLDFSKPFEIQFGGMHLLTTINELSEGMNFSKGFNIGYDYPFKIEFKNGKLLVSADIIDENLEVIATIEDNEWTVNENDIIARDRNYNDFAFEVVDAHLRPRLQVIVKVQNKIYIGGFFYTDRGALLAVDDTTLWGPNPEEIEEHIQKIFEYPSAEHLHEMIKPDS